jgi:glycosyltransferase involved in cell wall biosynthesis
LIELVVVLRGTGAAADRRRTLDSLAANTTELELRVVSEADSADVVQSTSADVVLLDEGTAVQPGWWQQLREAAYEDSIVATASAVPTDVLALEGARSSSPGRARVAAALGEPLWGCVYVRRDALNVALHACAGPDRIEDLIAVPGLVHVLAGAVVSPPPRDSAPIQARMTPAVRRTLAEVEAEVAPLRVTVDLRRCAFPVSGTQVHALNLVSALAGRDALRLSVLLPRQVHSSLRKHVAGLPRSVGRHTVGSPLLPLPHVFHRPHQVFEAEVDELVSSGARVVITHQDMILDRAPAYFHSLEEWRSHPASTALSFVAADEVVFYSEHARREAVREGLVDEAKTSVVAPGTNHLEEDEQSMPSALEQRARPFVLVIGNAYRHKNRPFALRVVDELVRTHGWDGTIVFAGGKPDAGSSEAEESAFLRDHPELAARVTDLGHVSDAERSWLYHHVELVLFPTLYEGFGLVPFEAAAAGTACVYASRSSVAEYLPPEGAVLELGDVEETARRLHALLDSSPARDEIVRATRESATRLTWDRAADAYVEIYRRALRRPVGLSLVLGSDVVVGARSQLVSTETERRALLVLRQVAVARALTAAMFAFARRLRRSQRSLRHLRRRD